MSGEFLDGRQVRRHFTRVAVNAAQDDFFAREIDRRMQERLDYVRIDPKRMLDLGASRCATEPALKARYPDAQYFALDCAQPMLRRVRQGGGWRRLLGLGEKDFSGRIAGDAAHLPLLSRSTDLIWSNLLLHWLDDPLPALAESHRVLSEGGLLMFSSLGPDTLKELRAACSDGYAHTQRFIDMHDLGDMLVHCGFADPVMDMEVITLTYDDFSALTTELRRAGSSCLMKSRRHGLTGKGRWARASQQYEALRQNGKLPATFEVVYGHAWKVAPKKIADGRSVIRFDGLSKK